VQKNTVRRLPPNQLKNPSNMFSNSKDQVSLEEAYSSVKRNVINEDFSHIANEIVSAIRSTGHMSPQIQGLVTLASFYIPGMLGAATVAAIQKGFDMASKGGVQHLLTKIKSLLKHEPKEEIVHDIESRTSKEIAQAYISNPTKDNLEAFLNDLKKSLDGAVERHGHRQSKKVANAISDNPVHQESANSTLRYLGGRGSAKYNPDQGLIQESHKPRRGSTLDYLK